MNSCNFTGRLTKNPEAYHTTGATPTTITKFTMAVERRFKKEGDPTADFLNFVSFGKVAELIERSCEKGTKLIVESRVQTGNYTNKDGVKVYTTDFVVESIEFAESKSKDGTTAKKAESTDGFMNIPDGLPDELPFS